MNMFDSDSEYEGYTETSDTDDQDENISSYDGCAQSTLKSLDDSIGRIDDYLSFERGFEHGDIVFSINDISGQMGRVMDINMIVDLESTDGEIVKKVNSKKLSKLRSFEEGDYVIHGPWIGKVARVYDLVTIMLDDGTKCKISTKDQNILVLDSVGPYEERSYRPGQRVKVNCAASFNTPRWFCGAWTNDANEGTVCKVEVGCVAINWIVSVIGASNSVPPHRLQNAESLTLLTCFSYVNWQLGDWCMYSPDHFQSLNADGVHNFPRLIPNHTIEMKKLRKDEFGYGKVYVITKTKTKVDVLWQDGDLTKGLDLETLSPVSTIGDHEFWPGQFVLEKAMSVDVHFRRFGIVKNVQPKECLLNVKWISLEIPFTTDGKIHEDEDEEEEIVSAYEVVEHPDYSYCLGDIVFRMPPYFQNSQEIITSQEVVYSKIPCYHPLVSNHAPIQCLEQGDMMKDQILSGENDYKNCFLSYIGNVVGFKNEGIEVRWANGITYTIGPSEIFGIEAFNFATNPFIHGEEIDGTFKSETSDQEVPLFQKREKELNLNDSGEHCMGSLFTSRHTWFPYATIGFIMKSAASYFGFHDSSSLPNDCSDDLNRSESSFVNSIGFETAPLNQNLKTVDADVQVSRQTNLEINFPVENNTMFKKFDIVDDCSDHYFVGTDGQDPTLSQVKRCWIKRVQKEWTILENNLPDSICVRVYEQRMDLLRASIVGAPGTPYQDALFFFDVRLPPEYPEEPPVVHYISNGLRLNPNLYESGRVCLSLLKTWTGTGNEVWNPENSTILQVLLSLQALVLNDKPYFNEAGYDKQIGRAEGERNSITYNENAFILARKSMLYQLKKSPKNFEELVEEHFASRSHHILHVCRGYILDTHVGEDLINGDIKSDGKIITSTGFKILLSKLLPKLALAFEEKGINCSQFLDQPFLALKPNT